MANSDGYPWENEEDRVEYTRVFIPTRAEQARMDAVLATAAAPAAEIRAQLMTPPPLPPRYAYGGRGTDILTCWQDSQIVPQHSIMDYTSDEAALQSTSRPALGQW